MAQTIDSLVITDTNREAFNRIIAITQEHDKSENLFIYGNAESGKSTAIQARTFEHDLLSTKRCLITHPGELFLSLTTLYENSQDYLQKLADIDVLFIDDFDQAFTDENKELVPYAIRLLVQNRIETKGNSADTVILAHKPLDQYDDENIRAIAKYFEEVPVAPLDFEGRVILLRNIQDSLIADPNANPNNYTFSQDALEFLASQTDSSLAYNCHGAEAILNSNAFEPNTEITASMITSFAAK